MKTSELAANSILLVDDNLSILDVVATTLQALLGVSVRCFDSPSAALQELHDHSCAYRMVISDFDMPGMNGAELLRAIGCIHPELPTILFSGSTEEEIVASRLPAGCHYLSKAGGFSQLIEAVRGMAVAA